jgi:hypothetical protein
MMALTNLFAIQGQWFEAQPFDGTRLSNSSPVLEILTLHKVYGMSE